MDVELVSFVKRGKKREQILMVMYKTMSPSEIAKATNLPPSHISRALKEFMLMGIVDCLNPKTKTGKLYRLTKKGEDICRIIKGGEIADEYSNK